MKKLLGILMLVNMMGCSTMAKIGFICAGAIGASYGPKYHKVDWTLPGSPAERIGIQTGDELLNPLELEGRPGEIRTVVWRHEDIIMEATVKLACVDDLYNNAPASDWDSVPKDAHPGRLEH